jgi:hypothetical protein
MQTLTESGQAAPLAAAGSDESGSAGVVSGVPDPDRRLSNGLATATRPVGMSAAVWARLERGGRRGSRPDQDLRPRPTVDIPNRSRRQDTDRIRTSDPPTPSGGDPVSSGVPSRPSPTPVVDRAAERANAGERANVSAAERANVSAVERANVSAAERANAGDGPANRKKGAGRAQTGAAQGQQPQSQQPQGQQQAESLPGAGGGKPLNRGPSERLDQRPVRRWLVRLDPTDTARQRGRQSAKRRYE